MNDDKRIEEIRNILRDIHLDTKSYNIKNLTENDFAEIATGLHDELTTALHTELKRSNIEVRIGELSLLVCNDAHDLQDRVIKKRIIKLKQNLAKIEEGKNEKI